jgi:hypothetical protein
MYSVELMTQQRIRLLCVSSDGFRLAIYPVVGLSVATSPASNPGSVHDTGRDGARLDPLRPHDSGTSRETFNTSIGEVCVVEMRCARGAVCGEVSVLLVVHSTL